MLLGARTQMLDNKYTFEEIFKLCKESGVEALEYCCEDYFFQYRPETTEDYTIAHINELSEKYGIKIAAVGNHLAFNQNEIFFDAIKKMIPKTKRLGTDVFIISSNAMYPGDLAIKLKQPELIPSYKKKLRMLLDVAEDCGVRLALEAEPPGMIPRSCDMMELMEEMNSPALCVNFDIGHAFLTDVNMFETIAYYGDKIAHVHVENMLRGEHQHRLLEDGDMDIKAVLKALKQAGYNGSLALDIYAYQYDEVLKPQMDYLGKLLKEIE